MVVDNRGSPAATKNGYLRATNGREKLAEKHMAFPIPILGLIMCIDGKIGLLGLEYQLTCMELVKIVFFSLASSEADQYNKV